MIETIQIPGYRIVRELGRGAMATVYLAIQEKFEREVALKVMSPLLERDPSFAIRFEREARIVAQLSHSSIVQVIDVDQHDGHHYLVMEYLPGSDLKARIRTGERGLGLALKVCIAIASALDFAHSKKFVHRDIKPANILFRQDATPVLTDFGIARLMDSSLQLTMVGSLIGTLDYMSPEQAKGTDLDGRSDLYSLGAVFYEVLTGSVPYSGDSTASLVMKQARDPPPRLPAQFAMFQPFLDQIMAKERDGRHATGGEVIRSLRLATEMANARRLDVIPKPSEPVNLAAEDAPTMVAPRRAPSLATQPEVIATVHFPATETRPSGIMPIPPEALAMAAATDATRPTDPVVIQNAEPNDVAAQALIAGAPQSHPGRTRATPAPGSRRARAGSAENASVRSAAAHFRRPPEWITIAAGICVTVLSVYQLAATRHGHAVNAVASAENARTPLDRASSQPGVSNSVSPENPSLGRSDTAAGILSPGQIETFMESKVDPETEARRIDEGKAKRPADQDGVNEKVVARRAAEKVLADEQANRNKQAAIRPLLLEAKHDLAQGHLWQPAGNSAADRYLAIEKIDANSVQARDGLARIFDAIIQEARNAAATGARAEANTLIQRLRVLRPDHGELPNLEALLDRLASKGSTLNSLIKGKIQRANRLTKSANSKLDRVPLTYTLLEGTWKEFRLAEQTAPLAPGLSQLRARFPESQKIVAKTEIDAGRNTQLQRLTRLARANGWAYADPAQSGENAPDQ